MAIQLFQAITTTIKKAAASIAGLTNNTTPKANNGTLVDSNLTWNGSTGLINGNLGVGTDTVENGEFQVGDFTGSENIAICVDPTTGFARIRFSKGNSGSDIIQGVILYRMETDTMSFVVNGGTLAININSTGGVEMPNLKSGTTQGAAGAAAGELWHDTNNNQIKIGV